MLFSLEPKTPLRNVFGSSQTNTFHFSDCFLNTPRRSALFSHYLETQPHLEQHFKPIYDLQAEEKILRAYDLRTTGVQHILKQKQLPIAIYTSTNDLKRLLEGAISNRCHLAIVSASAFQGTDDTSEDTHFSAMVYERTDANTASLYLYDPYRGFTLTSSMQAYLKQQNIELYLSDTPRSYALKGTSFAYAIQDIERLLQQPTPILHNTYTSKAEQHVFKLGKAFRYNGLEIKREYFQLMVDTLATSIEEDDLSAAVACSTSHNR